MNQIIDRTLKEAIISGVFPSADLLVAKGGEVVFSSHYGDAREHTCFDISSLTKPVCTATLTMMLVAKGLLKLTDTAYQWLAGARQPVHKLITVDHLLRHTSGLPAWQPYYRELPLSLVGTEAGKRFILDSCFNESLLSTPGDKTLYSDLGFIFLGEIIEQAGGESLDNQFMQRIAKPLGLCDTFFVRTIGELAITGHRTTTSPAQHVSIPRHGIESEHRTLRKNGHRRFAPTEDCPWRERVVHGEVDDQNAYALGGVAGHAGLFSTAADLHIFFREFVRALKGESNWIPHDIVRSSIPEISAKPPSEEFVFGWNRPSRKSSTSGHHFSANSIGHLGYTGCSMWIDLHADFWIILLTNRIHPSSTNQKIKTFRPMIHDIIYEELIAQGKHPL